MTFSKIAPLLISACTAHASIDLSGIADYKVYEGAQPALVSQASVDPVTQRPLLRHAYLVSSDTLAITIDEFGAQKEPPRDYIQSDNDKVELHGSKVHQRHWEEAGLSAYVDEAQKAEGQAGHFRFVVRDGKPLGHLAGPNENILWPVEKKVGAPLDREALNNASSYDARFLKNGNWVDARPSRVIVKSKPHGKANIGAGYSLDLLFQHTVYLTFDLNLSSQDSVAIDLQALELEVPLLNVQLSPRVLRTEAIQVNQVGYHPLQNRKVAQLSTWMGEGQSVNYDAFDTFHVVRAHDQKIVFTGQPQRVTTPKEPDYLGEETGPVYQYRSYVYDLDFSGLKESEGLHFIYIPELGVSFEFPIESGIWNAAAKLQMQGIYHQRSGTAMGPPATNWTRPRNFHPEDRQIHDVDRELYFQKDAYTPADWWAGNPFERLSRSMLLDTNLESAWGGWADAADYDRNIHHLKVVHGLLFLYELNPGFFERWQLSLPQGERSNRIPDLLDEALWGSQLFLRTQLSSGEPIEGIESIKHPSRGEASWYDSLPASIKPGTPSSAYKWASVAARMADAIQSYDSRLAKQHRESALKAVTWADTATSDPKYADWQADDFDKLSAAFYLYRLTKQQKWHDLFKASWTSIKSTRNIDQFELGHKGTLQQNRREYPIISYAMLSPQLAEPQLQAELRQLCLSYADDFLVGIADNTAKLLRPSHGRVHHAIVEAVGAEYLIAAHSLTQESKYVDGLLDISQFAMGRNPLNLSYTTGLGKRFIEPFFLDSEYAGLPYPSGIPAYGPVILRDPLPERSWFWDKHRAEWIGNNLTPSAIQDWPKLELYQRYIGYPATNEYTVHEGQRDQVTRWAYLAQHFSQLQ